MIDLFIFNYTRGCETRFRADTAIVIDGSSRTHTSDKAAWNANVFPILDKSSKKKFAVNTTLNETRNHISLFFRECLQMET